QGHNDVVVALRHGRAVPFEVLAAALFAIEDHAIGARRVVPHPAQKGRSEVEADARVIVDDPGDLVFVVDDAGGAVGGVALGADALVPVMIGSGGILRLHSFKPGVFAGRLVEVAVNADIAACWRHRVRFAHGLEDENEAKPILGFSGGLLPNASSHFAWRVISGGFFGREMEAAGASEAWTGALLLSFVEFRVEVGVAAADRDRHLTLFVSGDLGAGRVVGLPVISGVGDCQFSGAVERSIGSC